MGIRPYKAFTYDGESSLDYGVYLTGEGVFNAPERAVEMIEIPGRNGTYALDQGRFKNITVTYKAGMVDYSESDFADKMSDLRNWLCSKVGYCRLEDDYNPNEYRMAVYMSGIQVDHEDLQTGEFEITFDCKPQRWLSSGETATSVANNGTITNPTRFASSPLIQAWGYGEIDVGDYPLTIENTVIGDVVLMDGKSEMKTSPISNNPILIKEEYPVKSLNNGDTITVSGIEITIPLKAINGYGNFTSVSCTSPASGSFKFNMTYTGLNTKNLTLTLRPDVDLTFTKGTNVSTYNTSTFTITYAGGGMVSATRTYTFKYRKYTSGQMELLDIALYADAAYTNNYYLENGGDLYLKIGELVSYSTVSTVGNPTYLDMDTGEVYKIDSGEIITMNNASNIGSELATLQPGSTTVKYDNTITQLKIVPRWWKV